MTSAPLTTGYAIEALSCLARSGRESMRVAEIAESTQVPPAYLSKIFQRLCDAGIVESRRGYGGGVRLTKRPEEISLLEIDAAVESAKACPHAVHLRESTRPNSFWDAFHRSYCDKLASMSLAHALTYESNPTPMAL